MAKYHIGKNGNPSICTAMKNCPLGGAESHFDSLEKATAEAEKRFSNQTRPLHKLDKLSRNLEKLAEKPRGMTRVGNEYQENDPIGLAIDNGMTLSSNTSISNGMNSSGMYSYDSDYKVKDGNVEINLAITDNSSGLSEYKADELELVEFDPNTRPSDDEAQELAYELNSSYRDNAVEQFEDNDGVRESLQDSEHNIAEGIARSIYRIPDDDIIPEDKLSKIQSRLKVHTSYEPSAIFDGDDIQNYWDNRFNN